MSEKDMNPEEAARYAQGAEAEASASAAGQGQATFGAPNGLNRLLDGSLSGPSLGELERDYEFEKPYALLLRGVLRIADGDGVPPIGEILIGALLAVKGQTASSGSESDESDGFDLDKFQE